MKVWKYRRGEWSEIELDWWVASRDPDSLERELCDNGYFCSWSLGDDDSGLMFELYTLNEDSQNSTEFVKPRWLVILSPDCSCSEIIAAFNLPSLLGLLRAVEPLRWARLEDEMRRLNESVKRLIEREDG